MHRVVTDTALARLTSLNSKLLFGAALTAGAFVLVALSHWRSPAIADLLVLITAPPVSAWLWAVARR
jgi:hypothetical protein